jgi:hypothetical protein
MSPPSSGTIVIINGRAVEIFTVTAPCDGGLWDVQEYAIAPDGRGEELCRIKGRWALFPLEPADRPGARPTRLAGVYVTEARAVRWLWEHRCCIPPELCHLAAQLERAYPHPALTGADQRQEDTPALDDATPSSADPEPPAPVPAPPSAAAPPAGPEPPADDSAFRPASEFLSREGFPKSYGELNRALDENMWIKRRRPRSKRTGQPIRNRLEVHAGDWHRFLAQRKQEAPDPLDLPADIVDAAVQEVRRREAKERRPEAAD